MESICSNATDSLPVSCAEIRMIADFHDGEAVTHDRCVEIAAAARKQRQARSAVVHRYVADVLRRHAEERRHQT